jgi:serine/threonine protein kinase
MSDHETCLTASDLIAFSSGRLATTESSRVAKHVDRCPRCQTALEKIAGAPTVAHELPQAERPAFLGPPLLEGDLGSIDHYRVVALVGEGGMGSVFKGIDTVLARPVAIKVMKEVAVPFAKERMLREAQATAGVSSEYVATVYQVGQTNGVPYLAMEFLEGESLEDRLEKGKPRLDEVIRWSGDIAEGLAAAHAKGLIHRDIKPANIWLLPSGKVKILDFGLSRSAQGDMRLTQTGYVMGTPHYMSPEQATDSTVDQRSDLFSLGCVMYRMVTGTFAFPGSSFAAVLAKLVTVDPPPITDHEPGLPRALSELIQRLLAKKPENRPAHAAEVVEQLRGMTGDVPWITLPLPVAGRTTVRARAARRATAPGQGWLIGGGATVALMLIGLVAWALAGPSSRRSASKPAAADAIDKALDTGRSTTRRESPTRALSSMSTVASSVSPPVSRPPPPRPEPPKPPPWELDVTKLERFQSELVGRPGLAYLSDLTPSAEDRSGHGPLAGEFNYPVVVGNVYSPHGIFQHGRSPWGSVSYRLEKKYARFWSKVAVNDSVRDQYCEPFFFYVYGDGKELWRSPKMTKTGVVHVCDISVKDVEQLELIVYCDRGLYGTHGVWIEASVSEE